MSWLPYTSGVTELPAGRYTVTVENKETGERHVADLLLKQPLLDKPEFTPLEGEVIAYLPKPAPYMN